MIQDIVCNKCMFSMVYDDETTIYLKCPCCDNVLIDSPDSENNKKLVVVDFGIERMHDGDWMYVEVEDNNGDRQKYWKKNNF